MKYKEVRQITWCGIQILLSLYELSQLRQWLAVHCLSWWWLGSPVDNVLYCIIIGRNMRFCFFRYDDSCLTVMILTQWALNILQAKIIIHSPVIVLYFCLKPTNITACVIESIRFSMGAATSHRSMTDDDPVVYALHIYTYVYMCVCIYICIFGQLGARELICITLIIVRYIFDYSMLDFSYVNHIGTERKWIIYILRMIPRSNFH